MSDIHTWADGYGLWHASVPMTPDAAKVAKRAIVAELRQRDAHVSAARVKIRLEHHTLHGTVHYVEIA